ncbi:hypothetical protein SUGI_0099400 [Cryptomeria japonica]|nr:hypothetical protein SUGI_0099400 [Cryptomeria japonica]
MFFWDGEPTDSHSQWGVGKPPPHHTAQLGRHYMRLGGFNLETSTQRNVAAVAGSTSFQLPKFQSLNTSSVGEVLEIGSSITPDKYGR